MENNRDIYKVKISGDTCQMVKDRFNCMQRGKIEAKNKGAVDMYFAEMKLAVNYCAVRYIVVVFTNNLVTDPRLY